MSQISCSYANTFKKPGHMKSTWAMSRDKPLYHPTLRSLVHSVIQLLNYTSHSLLPTSCTREKQPFQIMIPSPSREISWLTKIVGIPSLSENSCLLRYPPCWTIYGALNPGNHHIPYISEYSFPTQSIIRNPTDGVTQINISHPDGPPSVIK